MKPIFAMVLLSIGLASAQNDDKVSQSMSLQRADSDRLLANQVYQSGNSMVLGGHVLAGGGMALAVLGSISNSPGLSLAGNLAYAVGVPLLGVGAGKVNRAGEMLDPSYAADYRGWGWYWTGMAMSVGGTLLIISAINDFEQADTFEEEEEASEAAAGKIIPGAFLLLGSAVCNITSWVKFALLAGEGQRAVQYRSSLDVSPTIRLSKDGSYLPGLALAYRF